MITYTWWFSYLVTNFIPKQIFCFVWTIGYSTFSLCFRVCSKLLSSVVDYVMVLSFKDLYALKTLKKYALTFSFFRNILLKI